MQDIESMKMKKYHRVPLEFHDQIAVAQYLRLRYPDALWSATAGGLRTSYSQAKRMKAMGLRRGVPDLLIFEPRGRYHGLAIEMKRESGGVLSAEQKWWIDELNKRGYKAVICRGYADAISQIDDYFADAI